jgi:hypothetical protein
MRALRVLFWAIVAAALVVVGIANRDPVTLRVLPEALAQAVGRSPDIEVPLFLAIFGGMALGLLVGIVWEWIREIPERAQARAAAAEIARLRAEVARLRDKAGEGDDDVLALLDPPRR